VTGATELHRGIAGVVLGTLTDAATVNTGKSQGSWVEVTLTGWIVRRSVDPNPRDGFDLAVTAAGGENLRAEPNGTIIAQLQRGTLLRKIGTRGGWVHVKRTGWLRRRSLAVPVETGALTPRQSPTPTRQSPAPPRQAPAPPRQAPAPPQTGASRAVGPPVQQEAARPGTGDLRVEAARAAPLAATPEGGRLGTVEPGTGARVIGRAGDWVRVQFEAWMREADLRPSAEGALVGVSAAEVRADPQRFVGQTVEWRVQFIAIQRADELRSELPAGQPFLLTRGPLPEPGFVYVILPRDQAAQFQTLPPLQELVLRVTIRAPRTKYLATPVVELVGVVSGMASR
jgi:hypothetical protein